MMDFSKIIIRRLQPDDDVRSFKCTDEDLNDFLFSEAKDYQEQLLAVTYLVINTENQDLVAYYSLLNDTIKFTEENKSVRNKINRKIPHAKQRTSYPAVKLGRLAVSSNYAHQGIGEMILSYIKHAFTHGNRTGCRFVTVDAYASAVPFYQTKGGFLFFTGSDTEEETRQMFYDLRNFR